MLEERLASSVRYLRITSADYREIIAGGLCADDLNLPIREQSEQTFRKAEEILKADMSKLDKTGLKDHLAPTRANALNSMAVQIKQAAIKMAEHH